MANINAFRSVVHKKKILKRFCYIKYDNPIWPFVIPGSLFKRT